MNRWYKRLLLSIITGLIGVGVFLTPYGQKLEEKFGLYWLFHLRGAIAAPDEVVVIAIDQPSATQFNLPLLPRLWPRDMHAQLIDLLAAAGARIIVFDLIFDSPSVSAEHDKKLAQAIHAAGNTILIERLTYQHGVPIADEKSSPNTIWQEGVIQLIPEIANVARASAPFPLPKAERVNDYWTFKSSAGDFPTVPTVVLQLYALPLHDTFVRLLNAADPVAAAQLPTATAGKIDAEDWMLALRQLFVKNPRLAEKIKLQSNLLDTDSSRQLAALLAVYAGDEKRYLNFYGPPRTIRTVPYFQALQSLAAGQDIVSFKDKVVFIGFSGATQIEQDLVRDDYHTVFSNSDGLYISGVEIAATAFANLLEIKPVTPLPYLESLIAIFLFGFVICVPFQSLSTNNAIACGLLSIAFYVLVAYLLFKQNVVWIPLTIPLFQITLAFIAAEALKHYWSEKKARQLEMQLAEIKKFLGSSFPNPIIEDALGKNCDEARIYGLCLTTDVEGYTALSEPMDPGVLSHLMMQYRNILRNPIKLHHGHVMDMTGDSMLAIWIADPSNVSVRAQACNAALNLAAEVERFNRAQPQDHPQLPTRIGLHSGEMALSRGEGNYSVVGDAVNTTNRIQNVNSILKTQILLSGEIAGDLDDFLIRALGRFLMPGRIKPIQLFELMAQRQSSDQQQNWLCENFTHALAAYHAQRWVEAERGFAEILNAHPLDGPSLFYRSLCRHFQENEVMINLWPIYRIGNK